jgi:hypothetical protein
MPWYLKKYIMMLKHYKYKPLLIEILYLISGTVVLSVAGFYNGYPLTFIDSGAYIRSGFTLVKPIDKPIIYGLFIRLTSLQYSAWFVIFFQNLLLCFVIYQTFKILLKRPNANSSALISIIILSFFTGISWFSNQIMPDIFTPLCIIVLGLLLFTENVSFKRTFVLSLILLLSNMIHYSNLLISVFLLFFFSLVYLFFARKIGLKIRISHLLLAWSISIASFVMLPTIHYFCGDGFKLSDSSHVILMGRLVQSGIIGKYLDESCQTKNYRICQYRDTLPASQDEFVWKENSPLYKTGGWYANKEEYENIIKDILTKPRFLILNFIDAIRVSLIQLTQNSIGAGLSPEPRDSFLSRQIQLFFKDEVNQYALSRQNNGRLDLTTLTSIQYLFLGFSFLFIIIFFIYGFFKNTEVNFWGFIIFLFAGIIINAAITATFSVVHDRYQCRVVWLLPMLVLLIIFRNFELIKNRMREFFDKSD